MNKLKKIINKLNKEYNIAIITWLPKIGTDTFIKRCIDEKTEWLDKYLPYIKDRYILPYNTPKITCRYETDIESILVDDTEAIRIDWDRNNNCKSIFSEDLLKELKKLI